MSVPANGKSLTRRILFQVHLWSGLAIGLYVLLIGLTGSVLVYDAEIRASRHPELTKSSSGELGVRLDDVASRAQALAPGRALMHVSLPHGPFETLQFEFGSPRQPSTRVFADPADGRILGIVEGREQGWLTLIETFHSHLFLLRPGRVANGIGGVLLLLMSLTGLYVWWPRKVISAGRDTEWKRFNWDLHSTIGFWSCVGIALLGFTGAYFTWPAQMMSAVHWITQTKEPPYTPDSVPGMTSLDAMLASARAALPDGTPTLLRLPSQQNKAVSVQMLLAGEWREGGASPVYLERGTARVLRVDRFSAMPLGYRIYSAFGPLHTGGFGQGLGAAAGAAIKILWFVLGIVPGVMAITGFLMWWNRVVVPWQRRSDRAVFEPVDDVPDSRGDGRTVADA